MTLPTAGRMLREDFLAREWRVASATADGVAADVAVRVADVVPVVLGELVVGLGLEGVAPEDEAVFHGEAEAFEEERVLQAAEMLEVAVFAERHVEVSHAEGEVLREGVDRGGVDGNAVGEGGVGVGEVGVWSGEILGEVV